MQIKSVLCLKCIHVPLVKPSRKSNKAHAEMNAYTSKGIHLDQKLFKLPSFLDGATLNSFIPIPKHYPLQTD